MRKDHYHPVEGAKNTSHPSDAYIYLVRNPSSNELFICAWDSVLYPGTSVVTPTRYGSDIGIVVSDASRIGKPYVQGDVECHGTCKNCPESKNGQEKPEDDQKLVAVGERGENGEIKVETEEEILWMEDPDVDQCSECMLCSSSKDSEMVHVNGDTVWIERLATPSDLARYQELMSKEDEAMRICREKIALHKLDMKLVTAHFLLGEPKILFFFTADVRVDFRELVKDLVSVFRIRIELRQIGVRDESRVLGGLAICGRDYCCHCVTDKLNPVSIKMAKEQNLSLNSMKISGPCGRLLCCLSYEYDFYVEEKTKYPLEGSRLKVDQELMKVTEVNILSKMISLSGSEGRFLTIPSSACLYNEETKRWEITKEYEEEFFSN
ncbi:MAG: regulatory iron-sulfur-containing complex subunit RicT [Sphaerochaetaceae bacterium]